ncbi:glycoside hydrolase family 31 protein [Pedobacter sp.]|uniref:glycoside hydrolase family 31 protein n=1 Tax=Pedobacter sp. TaxID=1411316 RepID=UPI003D7FCE6D
MYKKKLLFLCALFCLPLLSEAQNIGSYKAGFKKQGNQVSFETTTAKVRIDLCNDGLFRVRTTWNENFEQDEKLMVVKYDWPLVQASSADQKDHFLLQTAKINIKISKAPFRIDVYDKAGKLLSADQGGLGSITKNGDTVSCAKVLQKDEHIFGFGERMDFLDRRNKKLNLNVGRGKGLPHQIGAYNILEANYCPVPFFMSTSGYGLFFHNSFATEWDMGASKKDRYSFKAVDGEMDYYFFYGPDFPAILDQYTTLTGKSPMLSNFALGLHVGTYAGGTWGHESETSTSYVIALAKKYRDMGIPADLLWIDSTWRLFGENGGKGATSFEWRETFKDPKSMFDSIYAMNYKMVGLHIRPRFDNAKKLNLLDQAREKGFTYPEDGKPGEFVNFFDEKAVDWWWQNGVMRVAKLGAKFLKTDEGSAFGALANESDKVGPTGKDAERLHNVFPLAYAKAPFEKFQQLNNMRGLNQTREGYAGIQRYPYLFAGDWPSEWQYFAPVIKAGLNIGLSGVGLWAHCMGGFEHVADPELYIRWVQFGMFSPIAMVFGMDHAGYKEPWNYGEDALRNFKKYDLLRYRMIPYLYTEMYKQHTTGLPLMRALVLHNQDDENTYEIGDQYMLGDQLMVSPVTTKGAVTRSIYLPKGHWFNYWDGKEYKGEQYIHVVAPLDTIPLFVKGGGIIPMQPEMIFSGEKAVDVITLAIFPYQHSSYNLYEDDGSSLAYQKGQFALTKISSNHSATAFQLSIARPAGQFKPTKHTYLAKVQWNGKKPTLITENGSKLVESSSLPDGKKAEWYFDETSKVLWISTKGNNSNNIDISVK